MTRGILVTAIGLCAVMATPAVAQQYPANVPVCLQVYGRVNYSDCSYATIPQCQIAASGRSAQCIENPFYAGRQGQPQRERRGRRDY